MALDTAAIVAVTQLINLYGHVADNPAEEDLASVFADAAAFDQSYVGGTRLEGLEAIREFFGRPPGPTRPTFSVSHHTTNVYVFEDADGVRVRSKFLAVDNDSGMPHVGDYEDRVALTDSGWRITERVVKLRRRVPAPAQA